MRANRVRQGWRLEAGWRTSSSVRGAGCDAMAPVACHRCMFPSYFSRAVFHRNPFACRQLSFPAIPASLPAQFTNLTDLESLTIVGNGNSPGMNCGDLLPDDMFTRRPVAGSFPTNFDALTQFTSLHLENTALGALPETLQNLTSLTLVRNVQLGSSLPPKAIGSALQSLYVVELCCRHFWLTVLYSRVVNDEPLTLNAAQSAALCSRQLQGCDLRGTGIKTCGACLVG